MFEMTYTIATSLNMAGIDHVAHHLDADVWPISVALDEIENSIGFMTMAQHGSMIWNGIVIKPEHVIFEMVE